MPKMTDPETIAAERLAKLREVIAELRTCLNYVLYARFPLGSKVHDHIPQEWYHRSYEAIESAYAHALDQPAPEAESKAKCAECERLAKAVSRLTIQFRNYADTLEVNPGDSNPRQQRSGMVIMCRQSADRLDAALAQHGKLR